MFFFNTNTNLMYIFYVVSFLWYYNKWSQTTWFNNTIYPNIILRFLFVFVKKSLDKLQKNLLYKIILTILVLIVWITFLFIRYLCSNYVCDKLGLVGRFSYVIKIFFWFLFIILWPIILYFFVMSILRIKFN